MTAIAINATDLWSDSAESNEAKELARQLRPDAFGAISAIWNKRHWDLAAAYAEGSVNNWDGYGAKAVGVDVYVSSKAFLDALPHSLPDPEISPDADGEIMFTWRHDPRHILTITIDATGRLSFAALSGVESIYGTKYFVGAIPQSILDQLAELFPSRHSTAA